MSEQIGDNGWYDDVKIDRKKVVLFFVIDTSGSMCGKKIETVNDAMRGVIPEVKRISNDNVDAEIYIAVMQFDNSAVWITSEPQKADDFDWSDLSARVYGGTNLIDACYKLEEKLSKSNKNGFMVNASASSTYAPIIILMSDGYPNGYPNDKSYEHVIDDLKKIGWFKAAMKAAIAIGDDAQKDVLSYFTGSMETVLEAHNPEALRSVIQFVTVTSTQIGTKSSDVSKKHVDEVVSKQGELIENIKNKYQFSNDADSDQDLW